MAKDITTIDFKLSVSWWVWPYLGLLKTLARFGVPIDVEACADRVSSGVDVTAA